MECLWQAKALTMRHGKKVNHLGRKSAHRKAMLRNMANSLIEHKKITTTVAKAKALRQYVEPILTKSKENTTHSRRVVFSYLQNKEVVKELFGVVASRIYDRPGGYTRILKIGNRKGDNAEMAFIELVDFSEFDSAGTSTGSGNKKKKRRRGKSGSGSGKTKEKVEEAVVAEEVVEEVEEVENVIEDAEEVVEETVAETEESTEESEEEKKED